MHPLIVRYVVYPVHNFVQGLKGYKTVKYEKELMESQWFTPAQIEEIQQEKLRVLIVHAYKNVPFYTRLFDRLKLKPSDIKDIEDMNKLPLLRKENIRKNISAFVAKNIPKKDLKPMMSSGTTGPPIKLFKDKNRDAWRTAARHRMQKVRGSERGDKIVTIYGYSFPRKYFFQGAFLKMVKNEWVPYGYDLSEKRIGAFVKELEKYNPDFMRAWPSSVYPIAEFAGNNEIDLQPKNIWLHGEVLFRFQRKLIEKNFDCEIFDVFGLRESSVYSFECPEHRGYHLDAENGVIEVLNKDGEHVSRGELGATVFTDFTNFATPLIRYVSEDLAVYAGGGKCPCGRGLPLVIKSVEGRFSDCLSTDDGFVLPNVVVDLFSNIKAIKNFQVIQKAKDKILVKVDKKPDFSSSDADYIVGNLQKLIKSDVSIEIEYTNLIPLTPSGKKRFVISETPPEFIRK